MKLREVQKRVAKYESEQSSRGFPVAFRKTLGLFRGASWCLDLVNETGHSYSWWCMFKRINGHLVLNNHSYSRSTIKHINKASSILSRLKIKHITVEAPRGLQDLGVAKAYAADLYGRGYVEAKYSRSGSSWHLARANANIKNLEKIGVRVTKAMLALGIEHAETSRRRKLDELKQRRARMKQGQTDGARPGLTLVVSNPNAEEGSVA
jgi:hypothetical protein